MHANVHFSKIKEQIINHLKKAEKEIKVAVAWLTDEDIIRTLSLRKEAGINVVIVISDCKENFRNTQKFKDFIRNSGKLFIATKSFMHHKFCIIDNTTIINGSYNWTYYAQKNEENIVIINLDKSIKEDESFLAKFNLKHQYFCNKISTLVTDLNVLNTFKDIGKEANTILTYYEESEIKIRQELENDVKASFEAALAINIPISTLLLSRMKTDGGGVEFIKRILHDEMTSGDMKSGFKKLEEPIPNRVDLSLEYLASRPKYENLFTKEEVSFCKRLMSKYNL